jgi:hypothetical protein
MSDLLAWDGSFTEICDWKVITIIGEGSDSKVVKAVNQKSQQLVRGLSFGFGFLI